MTRSSKPHVLVEYYNLFLDLDFKNLRFQGKLHVGIESEENITLSSHGLTIIQVKAETHLLHFEQEGENLIVKTGPFKGVLDIEYSGLIPDILTGIYRAPYDNTHVVTTQFEASSARRMLPCVDDPGYKAEFRLTLKIDKNLDAISNMPAESTRVEDDKKVVSFQKTPKMSTYLIYLGVGKFEELKSELGKTDIAVATVPGKAGKGRFALEVAKASIDFYQSYFGIPYVLPKVHLVAVPEFAAGGMENWGAIVFRETALLIDEKSDVRARKRVSEVVAHEFAHMWFGDLVTMKWWDDLWLNESFATLMAFKVLDKIQPEWEAWQDFLRGDTAGAMSRDSIRSTHPIEVSVKSPSEIEEIFDDISYGKGASILRMFEEYLGAEDFRKGIENFLNRFKYQNAEGNDFWNALEDASGKKIRSIASEWIRKPGYPLITVTLDAGRLTLRQERFLLSGTADDIWPIPIIVKLNGEKKKILFDKREEIISVEKVESLKINVDQTGFYRVYYKDLYDLVWKSSPSSLDRWGIILDALSFLIAAKISFPEYLGLLKKYIQEQNYLPALEVSDQLSFLNTIVPSKIIETSIKFHREQLRILKNKTGENNAMLRGVFANRLAFIDENYAKDLSSEFRDYDKVEPNMKDAVATAFARTYSDLDTVVRKYRESTSDEERVRLLAAMMSFKDKSIIALSLGFAIGGDVKRQDIGNMIMASLRNPDAISLIWTWVKVNMDRLKKLFEGTETLSRIIISAIPILGISRVEEIKEFFDKNKAGLESSVEAGLEKLEIYDTLVTKINSI
ncbi:MAG: tricorn protease interacting factor [Thermoproteota archaeon]|nr:tricorn protease interacting factor [Thermoproteota archaeon]